MGFKNSSDALRTGLMVALAVAIVLCAGIIMSNHGHGDPAGSVESAWDGDRATVIVTSEYFGYITPFFRGEPVDPETGEIGVGKEFLYTPGTTVFHWFGEGDAHDRLVKSGGSLRGIVTYRLEALPTFPDLYLYFDEGTVTVDFAETIGPGVLHVMTQLPNGAFMEASVRASPGTSIMGVGEPWAAWYLTDDGSAHYWPESRWNWDEE